MINESLIIRLIKQDLKHNQLVMSLRHMGFYDGGLYDLDLMEIVAQLMGISSERLEEFTAIYGSFLDRANTLPINFDSKVLFLVAKECFSELICSKSEDSFHGNV